MAIHKITHTRIAIWLLIFCAGLSNVLKASHELGTARLSSPTATLNSVLYIQDNKFLAIASMPNVANWGFYDKSFKNTLTLGINRYSTAALADFVATVTVQVTSTAPLALGGAITILTKTLSVSYEGANDHTAASPHISIDQDVYSFANGYKVSTRIIGIAVSSSNPSLVGSTLPSNVYLESQMDAERYYPLNQNAAPFSNPTDLNIFYIINSDEFEVSWTRIPGAEEYDLEWLWLDEAKNAYWQNAPELDFRNNSTRIRTSQRTYRISNVFENGQVCFRVRGVGRASLATNAWEKIAYTPWSWEDQNSISATGLPASATYSTMTTANGNEFLFYVTLDGLTFVKTPNPVITFRPLIHEFYKNWQYKATYAEEGKKKEVVSYFDGSLRSRQSVTKNNSDNNAIVGETYYDYNGRAAVQALPVPVADATIRFYQYNVAGLSGFNFDETTHKPYGKKFFDEEAPAGTSTTCAVFVAGLDPAYGASNYYSAQNLNQQFAQGYVPNAEKFPISQTVYTNDNTGRIAAQGGVGKTHQVGTGHETKYLYGTPEQVEIDRLFGSEVGYNKHYKKNMVIDANGQVSISYIDQEGRTIATALTGQGPSNLSNLKGASGNVLYPAPTATNVLNADLLNKVNATDYDTDLDNNQRIGDKLTFTKKILVPTAGTYTVSYDLEGTSFTYSCLPTNACYDCVYDLEINVFDNCMNNPPGFTKITHTLGNILPPSAPGGSVSPSYTLDTQCNQVVNFSTSQLSYSGSHLLVDLGQGEYTVTKTLKINQNALSFYLNDYLKSDCVKQPSDFDYVQADTSGCGLTCDQCVVALGTKQDYLDKHKGTADDWEREYKVCREPCEYVSLCDAEYITMLADVSPGGQYGDWEDNNGDCNPALHPVSVYNVPNMLPAVKNFTVGLQVPDWKHPLFRKSIYASDLPTDFEHEYRDDDNSPSKVYITKYVSGTTVTYLPPVQASASLTPVDPNNTGNGAQYYVKPEQLDNVADFIANWQSSWARSLVFYHPEYPYYDWCLKNSTETITPFAVTVGTGTNAVTGYVNSSDSYDSLLLVTDDILTTSGLNLTRLSDPLSNDPYWTTNGYYYDQSSAASFTNSGYPVTATGTKCPQRTGTPVLTSPWNAFYKPIDVRYNNYSQSISVPAFAALITTSCVIQYGQPAANQLACLVAILNGNGGSFTSTTSVNNVGFDAILPYMPANLKNDYWNRFKSLYLSLKHEMQMEAAESYAMNGNYRGVNDGIGDPAFDAQSMSVPFTKYRTFGPFTTFADILKQWFFPFNSANEPQYCTPFTHSQYANKIKRFPNAKNATDQLNNLPGGDPGAQIYANTGLCPNAFYFQTFLNAVGVNNQITSSTLNLSTIPEFNRDLYTVVANGVIPTSFVAANWIASNTSNALTASMKIGSNPACGMTLNFPTGYTFDFSNTGNGGAYSFLKLYHLVPGTVSGGTYNFTIKADVAQASSSSQTFTTVILSGSTCIPLTGCSFTPPCEPTTTAIALQKLMNAIAATGNMCTAGTPVSMSNTTIQPFFVNTFGQLLGAGNWQWSVNGTLPNFVIKDAGGTNTNSLTITLSAVPCTSGSQHSFSNVSGSTAGNNAFNMTLSTVTAGTSITTTTAAITGTVNANGQPLKMGECSFDLAKCNTPQHRVRENMESFLLVANTRSRLQAASTNFTSIFNFGFDLRDQLANNYQTYNTGTQATSPLYYYWSRNSAVSTATLLTGHFMASTLTSVPAPDASACSFSLSFANTAGLSGQNLLSSSYTLSSFTLAPGPAVNNSVYDFSITATFGSTPFILKGSSSCFGMRACDECISPVGNLLGSTSYMMNDFPCAGAPSYTVSYSGGSYTNSLTACIGTTTLGDNNYTIQSSGTFDTGNANLASYDGSSLYWKNNVNFLENKYKQNFSSSYSCANARISFKVKDLSGSILGNPYLTSDFIVRVNGVILATSTSSTLPASWTELRYGTFSVTVGQAFSVEIFPSSSNDRYLIIDEIQLMLGNECLQMPCASTDSIAPFPEVEYEDPCVQYALDAAENEGDELYNAYIDSVKNGFTKAYIDKCMGHAVERMYMKYNAGDYHFTLYYYDQAGNLVRTVPPEGVHVETNSANLATIISERKANTPYGSKTYYTSHTLPTTYTYNSLNQLVKQETPDAGVSRFWYDALGRLVASQNAKQAAASTAGNYVYSYTRYDYLGRIAQVGEMTIASDLRPLKAQATATLLAAGTNSLISYPDNLTGNKREVTNTYYGDDASFSPLVAGSNFTAGSQEYLRSRVAAVTIEDTDDNSVTTYNHATHYSYDVHGNVKELIQENKNITSFPGQQLKKLAYGYDLISGKVNEVAYQKGLEDMFLHRYEYDADNRITAVYTSKNNVLWERDAKYFYYLHGPLARVETGRDKVQGTDYAYTLHGWIKGVNSNILKAANDIGKDGMGALTTSSADLNKFNGRDVYGYSLSYFNSSTYKDYLAINGVSGSSTDFIAAAPPMQTPDLYNGNIRQMTNSYLDASSPGKTYGLSSLLRNFTYDQLNRIETASSNANINAGTNSWGSGGLAKYSESFTYDQNGNILNAQRNGDQSSSLAMDNLTYHYTNGTNQLDYVTDAITGDPYSSDISTQAVHNYTYDAIGNLIKDNAEGITKIDWTVYGKIKQITFGNGKPNLLFRYDASGNRISKTAFMGTTPTATATTTYYVRDAQGNVMATYEQKPVGNNPIFSLTERHIYGSSRLGLDNTTFDITYSNPINTTSVQRILGYRSYEMANHLGNVMAVTSDRKIAVDPGNDGTTDYFTGEVLSANDYYAFGATMPGRNFTSSSYRYGFNGKETDPETNTQDYGMRIYNPNLGKFLSVDPLAGKYPFKTPYDFAENTPIWGNDLDGLELNINPYRTFLLAANKLSGELEKVNSVAKVTSNYELQAKVGVCKWVVNGLYSFAAMGGEQNPQVTTSTIPPCGGVAPYTKEQQEENKLKESEKPFEADAKRIVYGDLSEKTVGVLNIGAALSPLLAEESSIGGYQRDMTYWPEKGPKFNTGRVQEEFMGFNIVHTTAFDGTTYSEKVGGLINVEGNTNFLKLLKNVEKKAMANGAKKIEITGTAVVNEGFTRNSAWYERSGYKMEIIDENNFKLTKSLP
jgi:RHS repeat-associated protein